MNKHETLKQYLRDCIASEGRCKLEMEIAIQAFRSGNVIAFMKDIDDNGTCDNVFQNIHKKYGLDEFFMTHINEMMQTKLGQENYTINIGIVADSLIPGLLIQRLDEAFDKILKACEITEL